MTTTSIPARHSTASPSYLRSVGKNSIEDATNVRNHKDTKTQRKKAKSFVSLWLIPNVAVMLSRSVDEFVNHGTRPRHAAEIRFADLFLVQRVASGVFPIAALVGLHAMKCSSHYSSTRNERVLHGFYQRDLLQYLFHGPVQERINKREKSDCEELIRIPAAECDSQMLAHVRADHGHDHQFTRLVFDALEPNHTRPPANEIRTHK